MKIIRRISFALFIVFTSAKTELYSQRNDSCIILKAFRHWVTVDNKTKKTKELDLCGDFIKTDSMNFYTMTYGCENNIGIEVAWYRLRNDTLFIKPFDFLLEPVFLKTTKRVSTDKLQKLDFRAANGQPIYAKTDSSWLVRLINGRKNIVKDFTGNGIINIERNKYDAIELLQLTKIFHVPVVLFLDNRFDYEFVINQPLETLTSKFCQVTTTENIFNFNNSLGCFPNCTNQFKVESITKFKCK